MRNVLTRLGIACAMLALPVLATNTLWRNVAAANLLAAGTPPNGSYKQSCLSIGVTGDTLTAVCMTKSGGFKQTKLTGFSQCIGDITNINGALQCSKGNPPPKGSYQQTCTEVWTDGAILHATCQAKNGAWLQTTLGQYSACVGDIWNLGGFLRCNKGPPAPPGPYRQSCPDVWTVGSTIHARCISLAGKIRFSTLSNFSECRSPVNNVDGFLTCDRGTADAPIGPYKATCRNVVFQNGILQADCLKFNSVSWRSSEISQINACRSPISNVDGFLTCDRGTSDAPPGSYKATCRNVEVSGKMLKAVCRTVVGNWVQTSVSNFTNCLSISNKNGVLQCVLLPPTPTPKPDLLPKLSGVTIFNCDDERRTIVVWLRRARTINGPWTLEEQKSLTHAWSGSGLGSTCPVASAPSVTLTFEDNVIYQVIVVVPDLLTCEGKNDPNLLNCVGATSNIVRGDGNAAKIQWNFGNPVF